MSASLTRLTAAELAEKIHSREVSAVEVAQAHLDRIAAVDGTVHAFLHVAERGRAASRPRWSTPALAAGTAPASPLAGVPLALKDVFTTSDMPTTAGSKILEGWRPPYDATVTARLRAAGITILGKTNMDEFAMGSSTEHSAYGPTRNPWDTDRIPGGSGGGSAAALAAFEAPLAIGTDTGGSIRQPAAMTGTVGVKPTYGGVSRYGLIACASSLDQGGPVRPHRARRRAAARGHRRLRPAATPPRSTRRCPPSSRRPAPGRRRRPVRRCASAWSGSSAARATSRACERAFDAARRAAGEAGRRGRRGQLPALRVRAGRVLPDPAQRGVVQPGPVRRDALRPARRRRAPAPRRSWPPTREAGFGPEVKRRIILGTYALSSGYYDAYYGQAQKVRTLIARDFAAAFDAGRRAGLARRRRPRRSRSGDKVDDPLAMYLNDLATIPTNLAGTAALSVPSGLRRGRPAGRAADHGAGAGRGRHVPGGRGVRGRPRRRGRRSR